MLSPAAGAEPDAGLLFGALEPYNRIALAVSGGADSLAMLLLAARWLQGRAVTASVYTVDHGLRTEADAECRLVAEVAGRYGFSCHILRWTGDKPASGLQAAARQARYALIGAAMAERGEQVLLTAHHREDQAETVLMRMAHGSGLGGLGGMRAFSKVEGITVHRPLLGVSRASLAEVVKRAGITPVQDPSNAETGYERVRWRRMLPRLAELGLDAERLAELAARAERADRALAGLMQAAIAASVTIDGFGVLHVRRPDLDRMDGETGIRVLREALRFSGAETRPFALAAVESVHAWLGCAPGGSKRTLAGAVVQTGVDDVLVYREAGRAALEEIDVAPGASVIWDKRFAICNAGSRSFRVGPCNRMARHRIEQMTGFPIALPMAAVRAAPVVSGTEGEVLALGGHVIGPGPQISVLWPTIAGAA